mmetsp:Transcript_10698/g.24838  ORF Transcript_10698/g.24838 Transcript_10698/m.24838 type:complete len:272 (-) Transcript_10698:2404-3219(-)
MKSEPTNHVSRRFTSRCVGFASSCAVEQRRTRPCSLVSPCGCCSNCSSCSREYSSSQKKPPGVNLTVSTSAEMVAALRLRMALSASTTARSLSVTFDMFVSAAKCFSPSSAASSFTDSSVLLRSTMAVESFGSAAGERMSSTLPACSVRTISLTILSSISSWREPRMVTSSQRESSKNSTVASRSGVVSAMVVCSCLSSARRLLSAWYLPCSESVLARWKTALSLPAVTNVGKYVHREKPAPSHELKSSSDCSWFESKSDARRSLMMVFHA